MHHLGGSGGPQQPSVFLQEATAADRLARIGMVPWRGVRTQRYTYARTLTGPWLLFDNDADPYQQANLIDDPAARPLREELERELSQWMDRIGDALVSQAELMERFGLTHTWNVRQEHLRRPGAMDGAARLQSV